MAINEKNKGNEAFRAKDYNEACDYYDKSIELYEDPKVLSNRAAAYIKLKQYKNALSDCNRALEMDKSFLKPYNRRAQAN